MKIWFNRWFSTVYHYIEAIKNNPDQIEFIVYGTYPNLDAVYLQVCDVAGIEPDISGEEYIQFCLSFCIENEIDVFVPRKEMVNISANLKRFNAIGTKVLVCEDAELMKKIDNKALMYEELKGKEIVAIPEYRVVNNVKDFKIAYEELKEKGIRVCIKPTIGEGGFGFRVIDEYAGTLKNLYGPVNHKITYEQAIQILSQAETFPDLMLLEYLDGYEYSIDCLAYDGQLLAAVPRKKGEGRVRELEYNEELIEIARKVAEEYKIPYVFNVQVIYKDGIPKLLEINPRMAGGLHITSLAGLNYPYEAIKLLMNDGGKQLNPIYGIRATHVEVPVVLNSEGHLEKYRLPYSSTAAIMTGV